MYSTTDHQAKCSNESYKWVQVTKVAQLNTTFNFRRNWRAGASIPKMNQDHATAPQGKHLPCLPNHQKSLAQVKVRPPTLKYPCQVQQDQFQQTHMQPCHQTSLFILANPITFSHSTPQLRKGQQLLYFRTTLEMQSKQSLTNNLGRKQSLVPSQFWKNWSQSTNSETNATSLPTHHSEDPSHTSTAPYWAVPQLFCK